MIDPALLADKSWIFFTYSVTATLAANELLTNTIPIGGDADFTCEKLTASDNATNWTTRIFDAGSGQAWSTTLIHGDTLFGTGQRPFILPAPYTFRRGGSIQVDIQELDGAARVFYLSFHGIKIFG